VVRRKDTPGSGAVPTSNTPGPLARIPDVVCPDAVGTRYAPWSLARDVKSGFPAFVRTG
jgi:hypothetical protein